MVLGQAEMATAEIWLAHLSARSASRDVLREILGRHLGLPPDRVRLTSEPGGRPVLASDDHDLRFSLSHAGDLIVVAVTTARDVGIDIERADRRVADGVLRRALDDRERAHLASLPADRRDEAALRVWNAKEAYVKAIGEGLSHPLSEVHVDDPLGRPSLGVPGWTLRRFDPTPGYVGAIVVEGGPFTARIRGRV